MRFLRCWFITLRVFLRHVANGDQRDLRMTWAQAWAAASRRWNWTP